MTDNWTTELCAEVEAAHNSGVSWDELGQLYDVSPETLRKRIYRWRNRGGSVPSHQTPDMLSDDSCVHRDEQQNTMSLSVDGRRIKTLDDLIEACAIDLDVWQIVRVRYNKWEVGAKCEKKDLTWADGSIVEGQIQSDGQLTISPLFQVRVDCVRRDPIPIFPTIQPVRARTKFQAHKVQKTTGLVRSLICADPHFGFRRDMRTGQLVSMHHRPALDLIVQIAKDARPDRIDCLGDILDLAEWSDRFLRSPEVRETTQPAILEAHWWLAQIRQVAKRAQFRVHEGNHDARLEKGIITHLLAACGLRKATELEKPPALSVPGLLDLQSLGIGWVGGYPDDEDWLTDSLVLQHGDTAQGTPGGTARKVAAESDVTRIYGHVHRWETVPRVRWTRYGPVPLAAMSVACCCKLGEDGPPARTNRNQWQVGFMMLDYDPNSELIHPIPVYVQDNRAIWNGRIYTARDRMPEIKEYMHPWRV